VGTTFSEAANGRIFHYKSNKDNYKMFVGNVCLCVSNNTVMPSHLLTYLPTPWSRVLLDKLTSSQLIKKLPTFYDTRRFITAVTNARHLSLSWPSSIQSIPPHPNSWRPIL